VASRTGAAVPIDDKQGSPSRVPRRCRCA